MVLDDLVIDIAQAGVTHGDLGQAAVVLGLHDGPARASHDVVDLLL